MIVDGDLEIAGLLAGVLDAIGEVGGNLGQADGEDRVGEAPGQRQSPHGVGFPGEHEFGAGGDGSGEPGEHDQARTPFERHVAGSDGDAVGANDQGALTGGSGHAEVPDQDAEEHGGEGGGEAHVPQPMGGDHMGPVVAFPVREGFADDAFLQVTEPPFGVRLLLDGGQQEPPEFGVQILDFTGGFPRVDVSGGAGEGKNRGADQSGDGEQWGDER